MTPDRPQIVFTGTMRRGTVRGYMRKAEKIGLSPTGTMTRRTALVVAGEGAGGRSDKARRLGVKVIPEDQWADHLSKYACLHETD